MDNELTDIINKDKDQHNDAIGNDPRLDSSFNLSKGNKEHLPVVTVSLRGGKKHRATTIAGRT